MKVGDLVKVSVYGNRHAHYTFRNAKYGIVVSIENDQMIMMNGSYKDIIAYRVRWFDHSGNPIGLGGFVRSSLKFLNKTET